MSVVAAAMSERATQSVGQRTHRISMDCQSLLFLSCYEYRYVDGNRTHCLEVGALNTRRLFVFILFM